MLLGFVGRRILVSLSPSIERCGLRSAFADFFEAVQFPVLYLLLDSVLGIDHVGCRAGLAVGVHDVGWRTDQGQLAFVVLEAPRADIFLEKPLHIFRRHSVGFDLGVDWIVERLRASLWIGRYGA